MNYTARRAGTEYDVPVRRDVLCACMASEARRRPVLQLYVPESLSWGEPADARPHVRLATGAWLAQRGHQSAYVESLDGPSSDTRANLLQEQHHALRVVAQHQNAVLQPARRQLRTLRRPRHHHARAVADGLHAVRNRSARSHRSEAVAAAFHRPHQQRRPLRAGQPALGHGQSAKFESTASSR